LFQVKRLYSVMRWENYYAYLIGTGSTSSLTHHCHPHSPQHYVTNTPEVSKYSQFLQMIPHHFHLFVKPGIRYRFLDSSCSYTTIYIMMERQFPTISLTPASGVNMTCFCDVGFKFLKFIHTDASVWGLHLKLTCSLHDKQNTEINVRSVYLNLFWWRGGGHEVHETFGGGGHKL
jgi:hypothetical protein